MIQLAWTEAQAHCNFVAFAPQWLPADCHVTHTTLRPEQPPGRPDGIEAAKYGQTPWSEGNPCSLRTLVSGKGRAFRLKQFLYDWTPNAAGIASLWDSPSVTPFDCGEAVAWRGIDYHDKPGACVTLARTTLELVVIDGAFTDDEIETVMQGLAPAAPEQGQSVDALPFHQLSYWVHYGFPPTCPPYGLWAYRHRRQYAKALSAPPADPWDIKYLVPRTSVLGLDSRLYMADEDAGHREIETLYRGSAGQVWMTAMAGKSRFAPSIPPQAEDHAASERGETLAGARRVWLAGLTADIGPWEAFWEEDGCIHAAWFGSNAFWRRDRVVAFLANLEPAP